MSKPKTSPNRTALISGMVQDRMTLLKKQMGWHVQTYTFLSQSHRRQKTDRGDNWSHSWGSGHRHKTFMRTHAYNASLLMYVYYHACRYVLGLHLSLSIYIYIYTFAQEPTHTHAYIHICVCICIYIYIYI